MNEDPAAPTPPAPASTDWSQYLTPEALSDEATMKAATAVLPAQVGPLKSAKNKVSVSSKGMTEGGLKKSGDLFAEADKKAEAEYAPYQAQYESDLATQRQHESDLADAFHSEAELTQRHEERNRRYLDQLADFHQHSADMEMRIHAEAVAQREQYIGAYREQLAGVRQLIAQSGNPLNDLSKTEALGLGFAQFAQGFLAAQGIQIDVSGQVDRWVERSLREHQMKIENARGAAQDVLSLYNIARQSSADDAEARSRYRGFVVEGLKTAITANAARFNSQIAMSRANQQVAKLQLESDAVERQMADANYNKFIGIRQMEKDEAYKRGQLALEQQRINLEAQRIKDAAEAKAAKEKAAASPLVITDPEYKTVKTADGKEVKVLERRWAIDPSQPKEIQGQAYKRATEARDAWAMYQDRWQRVMELRKKAMSEIAEKQSTANGIVGLGMGLVSTTTESLRARSSAAYREYQAARKEFLRMQVRLESGLTVTDQEARDKAAQYPEDRIFEKGSNVDTYITMRENARKDFERIMEIPGIIKADGGLQEADEASPTAAADYRNTKNGGEPVTPLVAGEAAQAAQGSTDTRSDDDPSARTRAYAKFEGSRGDNSGGKSAANYTSGGLEPEYARHYDAIAKAAIDPKASIQQHGVDENPDEVQAQALEVLQRHVNDQHLPGDRRRYAKYLLQRIEQDPDQLLIEMASDKATTPKFQ